MDRRFDAVIGEIKKRQRFLIISHLGPEGDAIGSLLGLSLALRDAGKDAVAFLEDPLPPIFNFLPGAGTIVHDLKSEAPFDATIAVDCGQKERLGKLFNELASAGRAGLLMNVDHHATNDSFGDLNVIEPGASAAGEMVYDLIKAAGMKISRDAAVNLYVAIHTDTGSFRYSSSTPGAFKKAGELVELGADPWDVATRVYENQPVERYRLLAMALSTLKIIGNGDDRVATMDVTLDMFKKVGGGRELSDGFVNFARAISGVEVGLLYRESAPGEYKVSMRSKGKVDVAELAAGFGGGGHRNAAGFNAKGSLDEIKKKVEAAINEKL
jgi:phosphoesterase RecJ-like protein